MTHSWIPLSEFSVPLVFLFVFLCSISLFIFRISVRSRIQNCYADVIFIHSKHEYRSLKSSICIHITSIYAYITRRARLIPGFHFQSFQSLPSVSLSFFDRLVFLFSELVLDQEHRSVMLMLFFIQSKREYRSPKSSICIHITSIYAYITGRAQLILEFHFQSFQSLPFVSVFF